MGMNKLVFAWGFLCMQPWDVLRRNRSWCLISLLPGKLFIVLEHLTAGVCNTLARTGRWRKEIRLLICCSVQSLIRGEIRKESDFRCGVSILVREVMRPVIMEE